MEEWQTFAQQVNAEASVILMNIILWFSLVVMAFIAIAAVIGVIFLIRGESDKPRGGLDKKGVQE